MIDLRHGDCLEIMKGIPDNSVDLVLSDPPYELGFMGKKWDNTGIAFSIELWKEVYRILKPGGYCMAFSGTRTYHRMAVTIEDAGFEIKDMIEWVYGSGFPKGLDISKQLQKKGQDDLAKQYEGYKTHLKPAHEPICLAMKPLSEKTFAENVMKSPTAALNIGGTRIGNEKIEAYTEINEGRYPANFIISEDIAPVLDKQSGYSKSVRSNMSAGFTDSNVYGTGDADFKSIRGHNDEGGASRFFYNAKIEEEDYIPFKYTAKASKKERNSDINGNQITGELKQKIFNGKSNKSSTEMKDVEKRFTTKPAVNNHTTVKPISIMEYLAKLGLPPYNAVVLDMFAGSGSTGMAIEKINKETGSKHKTILIERESEYIEIIKKRLNLEEE